MGRMSLKYDGDISSKRYKKDIANISRIAISVELKKIGEKTSGPEIYSHEELGGTV